MKQVHKGSRGSAERSRHETERLAERLERRGTSAAPAETRAGTDDADVERAALVALAERLRREGRRPARPAFRKGLEAELERLEAERGNGRRALPALFPRRGASARSQARSPMLRVAAVLALLLVLAGGVALAASRGWGAGETGEPAPASEMPAGDMEPSEPAERIEGADPTSVSRERAGGGLPSAGGSAGGASGATGGQAADSDGRASGSDAATHAGSAAGIADPHAPATGEGETLFAAADEPRGTATSALWAVAPEPTGSDPGTPGAGEPGSDPAPDPEPDPPIATDEPARPPRVATAAPLTPSAPPTASPTAPPTAAATSRPAPSPSASATPSAAPPVLPGRVSLGGAVRADARALPDLTLRLHRVPEGFPEGCTGPPPAERETRSDAEGAYAFRDVPAGWFLVSASAPCLDGTFWNGQMGAAEPVREACLAWRVPLIEDGQAVSSVNVYVPEAAAAGCPAQAEAPDPSREPEATPPPAATPTPSPAPSPATSPARASGARGGGPAAHRLSPHSAPSAALGIGATR